MSQATATVIDRDPAITFEEAWDAVLKRNRAFDGAFLYAVRTTGIYCRPSCPSRRPKRDNVTFFGTTDGAEAAGYRACRRCHPRSERGTTTEYCVRKAVAYLEANVEAAVTLDELARHVGLSPFHLQRTFKSRVGVSPHVYQRSLRMKRMRSELRDRTTVSRAAFEAGFGSLRGAYEQAPATLGMTPGEYMRGAEGVEIRYTLADSPFGLLLVGATAVGVCAVSLGDTEAGLVEELTEEFPGARLHRDDDHMRDMLDAILAHLEGDHPGLALPLDLHGTAFEVRVWSALQEIPRGETRSYGEIAEAIGAPGAARAVARACASNKAAVVVPCHRVVRADGTLAGYRWGRDRKKALLEQEARSA